MIAPLRQAEPSCRASKLLAAVAELRRDAAFVSGLLVCTARASGTLVGGCYTMIVAPGCAASAAVKVGCSAGKVAAGGMEVGVPTGALLLTCRPRTKASS